MINYFYVFKNNFVNFSDINLVIWEWVMGVWKVKIIYNVIKGIKLEYKCGCRNELFPSLSSRTAFICYRYTKEKKKYTEQFSSNINSVEIILLVLIIAVVKLQGNRPHENYSSVWLEVLWEGRRSLAAWLPRRSFKLSGLI